jgi:hypothetical protein
VNGVRRAQCWVCGRRVAWRLLRATLSSLWDERADAGAGSCSDAQECADRQAA